MQDRDILQIWHEFQTNSNEIIYFYSFVRMYEKQTFSDIFRNIEVN